MADATVKIDLDAGGVNAGLERLKASALALDVATKRLEATWEDAGDAFEEGAQKLLDARNRADEFGASIGQQRAVVEAATRAAERYNKPLAITARFMEELVIETQDATKAGAPVVGRVPAPLADGKYTLHWTAASGDGHAVKGSFGFAIKSH